MLYIAALNLAFIFIGALILLFSVFASLNRTLRHTELDVPDAEVVVAVE